MEGSKGGLLVVEDHGYTAVLICMMLQMSGYEVICQLKADPLYRLIPVFILTTTFRSPAVEQSIAAGASGYYKKPNSIAELNSILRQLCEMAVD